MDRLERLINLLAALLEAEHPLPRQELRRRVPGYPDDDEAFRRAFERDKEQLRDMGIPIVLEPVPGARPEDGEGYRVPKERYQLPDPDLAPDELAALHLAASAVRIEGATGAEAMWKLGGAPGPDPALPSTATLPGSEHLPVLFDAVARRAAVRFTYKGEGREVEPHRLAFRTGRWYLLGRDRDRAADRMFRLERMESVPEAGPPGAFEPTDRLEAGQALPWEMGEEEEVTARLLVDASHAGWAIGHLGDDALEERRDDGSAVLSVRVTHRAAFRSFVLGFLDHAEVLDPPELRDEMVRWLEALAQPAATGGRRA